MNALSLILFFASIIALLIGLNKPSLMRLPSRGSVAVIGGIFIVLFFILFGITMPDKRGGVQEISPPSNIHAESVPSVVSVSEAECQKTLDEILAVVENRPTTKSLLTKNLLERTVINSGLKIKNPSSNLPNYTLPDSHCGNAVSGMLMMIVEGAKKDITQ